jgi:hypothetical protein
MNFPFSPPTDVYSRLTHSTPPFAHNLIRFPAIAVSGGTLVNPLPSPACTSSGLRSLGARAFAVSLSEFFCEFSSKDLFSEGERCEPAGVEMRFWICEREKNCASGGGDQSGCMRIVERVNEPSSSLSRSIRMV